MDRFWSKVDKRGPDECWPWKGCLTEKGYGAFGLKGKTVRAHRVAFFLEHGRWPEPNGLHECDNPPCCNPRHVFEGTQQENMADKCAKGRERGKLSHQQRMDVRANWLLCRVTQVELGARFGVSSAAISFLVKGIRQ